MPGLGPRVGGAHVDVNLKFDDKSVSDVGKQIHQQLKQIGERNRKFYQAIGKDAVTAWRAALGLIVTSAPLLGSAISAVAGTATILAGSLNAVLQSAFALGPLLGSIGIAAGTAALGFEGFGAAIKASDPEALAKALKNLSPAGRAAALAVRSLKDEAHQLRLLVQEKIFAGLDDEIRGLSGTLFPVLEKGLGRMAEALNGLFESILDYTNSESGLAQINNVLIGSADVFDRLAKAAVPFLEGLLRLFNALLPSAGRLADNITDVAESFQAWTQEAGFAGRIDDMMKRAEKTAGLLLKVLGNLGAAISNVFEATNPATNRFLEILVDLTQRFEDFTSSVGGQESIAKWANQSVDVMVQFGKTIGSVFKVVAELADPRVIISFLNTVEGAFDLLGKLPLDSIVNAFVQVAQVLQPVSSLFLAIIIAGVSLNILLGSLLGQFGGLFSVLSSVVKFKILTNILKGTSGGAKSAGTAAAGAAKKTSLLSRAGAFLLRIFNKIKSIFSSVIGFFTKTGNTTAQVATKAERLSKVFKPVLSILGKFAKFAGPVGIAVWIGSIIAKSEELQDKFGELFGALKGVGSSLIGAFEEIGESLKPLAPAAKGVGKGLGFIFDILDEIVELGIGVVLDLIIQGFKSLADVVKGAGKIIAGIIDIFVGLFSFDFGKVGEGFKKIFEGIGPLLEGLFGLFVSLFAPARIAKFGFGILKGLAGGIVRAIPGLLALIGRVIFSILKFFITLPIRLFGLGKKALISLGAAVIAGVPFILSLFTDFWNKLKSLAQKGFDKISSLIRAGWEYVKQFTSDAFEFLKQIVKDGLTKAKEYVVDKFHDIVGFVKKLPGKIANAAKGMWDGITDAFRAMANKLIGLWNSLDFSIDIDKKLKFFPDINIHTGDLVPDIPTLAKGGIAKKATLAVIGEAGPEAVIPLSQLSSFGLGKQTLKTSPSGNTSSQEVIVRFPDTKMSIVLDNGEELSAYIRGEAAPVAREVVAVGASDARRVF